MKMSAGAEPPFFCESRPLKDANRSGSEDDVRITAAAFAPVSVDCCPSPIPQLTVRSRRFPVVRKTAIEPLGSTGNRSPGSGSTAAHFSGKPARRRPAT